MPALAEIAGGVATAIGIPNAPGVRGRDGALDLRTLTEEIRFSP